MGTKKLFFNCTAKLISADMKSNILVFILVKRCNFTNLNWQVKVRLLLLYGRTVKWMPDSLKLSRRHRCYLICWYNTRGIHWHYKRNWNDFIFTQLL
jgi:hypothetical protein